uniref:Uncharacterized protein n=1 Tax=Anguilla anguilla TaxID=7936 RepID=A0A0E9RYM6_ANGAN
MPHIETTFVIFCCSVFSLVALN